MTTGLDFGAVDVIWNAQKEKPYVLEINTAPGLEGQTIADYAAFFSGDL
jgi:D-alanine-D-alanine ligase-like ATP-grasp enzyme